ncbi:MAG: pyridine nucleotide-disulfide oxidoreductase [Treponema sp.]|nr:MAG: pyridine nucleotide-disulfide oxidoreductase [Treponema sp.]
MANEKRDKTEHVLYDVAVIGGGPAGLAAAISAKEHGSKKVIIIERDHKLGGILNQCIHSGFGLHEFKEELTGPEYAERFIKRLENTDIEVKLNAMVVSVNEDKAVEFIDANGKYAIKAKAIVLAMGCRERTGGAIALKGFRPAGIYTAGMAQRLINMDGYMVGKEVVIYGSGDIGLIMARRMTLEGAKVKAVVEIMPFSSGLNRNIAQCLEDFDIPLLLGHSIEFVHGDNRVEGVTIARLDENRKPIESSKQYLSCDTVLLSVGLIPENELSQMAGIPLSSITGGAIVNSSMQTKVPGIFSCGNVLHVHDIVDFVSRESRLAGKNASLYAAGKRFSQKKIDCIAGNGVRYVLPSEVLIEPKSSFGGTSEKTDLYLRVDNKYANSQIEVTSGDTVLAVKKIKHMIPSEMITVSLSGEKIDSLTQPIKISVKGVAK